MPVELKSVEKPVDEGHEAVAVEAPREVLPGSGKAAGEGGSASKLLVRGKGTVPTPADALGGADAAFIESIIGVDQRTRILETELAPWRMICALSITSPVGGFVGTGWFVGPRTVVTAGHCVFHRTQMGGWATEIRVSPGRDGQELPFGTITARRFSTVDRWIEAADPDFDYGVIHLDAPVDGDVGWFGVGALPDGELQGALVNVSGYPGDKFPVGTQQWFHANSVVHVSERRIFYQVDTFGGQSGSPAWIYPDGDAEAPPVVVGIHAYGIGGTPASLGITANSAPRILPEVVEVIRGWVEEDGGWPEAPPVEEPPVEPEPPAEEPPPAGGAGCWP